MKSTGRNVGSVNLRGKIEVRLRCGCCSAFNLKAKYADKQAKAYISEGWGGLE